MNDYGYKMAKIPYVGMGARIDDLQFEHDINGKQLGDAIGVDRKRLYVIKEFNEGRLSEIVAIANYFKVSLDWLVYGKGDKNG